jgi:RNA polymerase sigma-70 factor (ECF subfamily)
MSTTSNVGENERVSAPKRDQDERYRLLADEYGDALDRLAYAYEADPDRRRDLLQEIHFQLWRSLDKFDSRCSLRTWTYRVAHNVATSHVIRQRRRNARTFVSLEEAESKANREDIEVATDRNKALTRLLALIQKLEPIDRQLILAYLEDLDAESMREITGLSVTNVWTKIHLIKNILTREFHAGGRHG